MKHGYRGGVNRKSSTSYQVWIDMVRRCYNEKHPAFKWYGAKGITVCDEWHNSFESFLNDMGDKPKGMSLDRMDVLKGYYAGNCRWATDIEQQRNRSNNKLNQQRVDAIRSLRSSGKKASDIATMFGISDRTVRAVVRRDRWA